MGFTLEEFEREQLNPLGHLENIAEVIRK